MKIYWVAINIVQLGLKRLPCNKKKVVVKGSQKGGTNIIAIVGIT